MDQAVKKTKQNQACMVLRAYLVIGPLKYVFSSTDPAVAGLALAGLV